ncbi:bifunctional ornithine acetyltransferase/N-acetylglutamate synthase [Salirhabdus sp. Marseille-P4669]|uniref:bifunctional ornithine acetyltransferase/N-acetylglutamate synthase n=1 Tax=Salirhabdus sp. Marseille-P4669 TaxID=2042310 RepID=UPI000C7ABC63|nr:bifunctional ornithine acetyltransferase/N-acetylglutamate synthase [Salirhabdus sp. Marseille-P4669]
MSVFYEVASEQQLHILTEGNVTTPQGFSAGGLHCGIKRKRKDLGWIYSEVPAVAAGVYTTNHFQAAPLEVTQDSIAKEGKLQAILVNSGKANAFTGPKGIEDAYEMRNVFSETIGLKNHYTAVVSTGVIGELLPMEKIKNGIKYISTNLLNKSADDFEKSILTTDTFTKNVAVELTIDGKLICIGGAAKGSGMIHPNMATMLGFITTDAHINHEALQLALQQVTNKTFNCISVDGDSSTNDMVLVMANGLAANQLLTADHKDWNAFVDALQFVCECLAKQIARDGEGATKLVEVEVKGVESDDAARKIAKTIISSNLVKTAIYGEDPNWGRIVCAVGYSDIALDPNVVSIAIGNTYVLKNGVPKAFNEPEAKRELEKEHIKILVECNQGEGQGRAWGCDLSYDYVRINASYRT